MYKPCPPGERDDAIDWSSFITDEEWEIYRSVIERAEARGLRFAVGGGLAFSYYAGRARNTKDMDLFILPAESEAMTEATLQAGMEDYFGREEYERHWIYRAYKDGVIVDLIWAMANRHAEVDESWLTCGPE